MKTFCSGIITVIFTPEEFTPEFQKNGLWTFLCGLERDFGLEVDNQITFKPNYESKERKDFELFIHPEYNYKINFVRMDIQVYSKDSLESILSRVNKLRK